jgi:hypothetical protein
MSGPLAIRSNRLNPSDDFAPRISPYRHAILAPAFRDGADHRILRELERKNWKATVGPFYRFKVPAEPDEVVSLVEDIQSELGVREWRESLEAAFGCALGARIRIDLHKYGSGDGIGPHTDASVPEVRCVLQVNRGWNARDGGVWILARDSALRESPLFLPSLNNTAFVFSTGRESFHALSTYRGEALYSIVVRISREGELAIPDGAGLPE